VSDAGLHSADGTVAVSAMVTAYDRTAQTLEALRRIRQCRPQPVELLVHVDANADQCAAAIRSSGLADTVVLNEARVGPGGGRNRLMAIARCPIVASFDDDSWPLDADFFSRLVTLFDRHPEAAVIGASVFHRGEPRRDATAHAEWRADFVGAGCAYRRADFLSAGGYVPLATAYGMEEVDLSLRLHAAGRRILHSEWLRVEHDTDLSHHASPEITAASVANIALLTYLRYPASLWPVGLVQGVNRVWWLVTHGRRRGVWQGLVSIRQHLRAHEALRSPLPAQAVRSFLALRRGRHPFGPVVS